MMSSLDVDCFLKKQLVDIVELIVLFLKTPMLPPTFSQLATMTIQKSHAYIYLQETIVCQILMFLPLSLGLMLSVDTL